MRKPLEFVFKLYLLVLIFQLLPMFRAFKNALSANAAINNGMFFMLVGLVLLLLYTGGILNFNNTLLRKGVILIFSLVGLSFVTSLLLYSRFGTLYGETTLKASFPSMIYYLLIAVAFFFHAHLFDFLSKKTVEKLMDLLCWFNIILGAIQVTIALRLPLVSNVYDKLDVLDILVSGTKIWQMGRITLTGSEPSTIGITVCCFLLPYAMSQFLCHENRRKYLFFTVAFVVLCFFALSSAVLVALLTAILMLFFFASKKTGPAYFLITFLTAAIVFVLILGTGVLDDTKFGQQISFLLVEKTTSDTNLSSGFRYTTVINDIVCFLKYPVSGVGNGNQGFLYNDTMNSAWVSEAMRNNYQTVKMMSGSAGVLSGGAFVPAFISGYGVVGLALLWSYVVSVRKKLRAEKEKMNYYYYWFYIGAVVFLVISTVAGSIEGNFIVMFVLSLPFAAEHNIDLEGGTAHGPRNLRHNPNVRPG